MGYLAWYILPIIDVLFPLIAGIMNKLGRRVEQIAPSHGLGNSLEGFINSSSLGDWWVVAFGLTFIIGLVFFVYANSGKRKSAKYQWLWIIYLISLILSMVIIAGLF